MAWGLLDHIFEESVQNLVQSFLENRKEARQRFLERIHHAQRHIRGIAEDQGERRAKSLSWIRVQVSRIFGVAPERLPAKGVESIFNAVSAYASLSGTYMEDVVNAAEGSELENEIFELFAIALEHFHRLDDFIPDDLGAVGLLDDAYFTCRLIERIITWNSRLQDIKGIEGLDKINRGIFRLMPPAIAQALEAKVNAALEQSRARQAMERLSQKGPAFSSQWNRTADRSRANMSIIRDSIGHDLARDGIYIGTGF